jgi:pimeloyl-ACP methyl ester carboxylesterase
MQDIALPLATIDYRAVGPEDSPHPPVVFIHGVLVDGHLWDRTADLLAARGYRCYQPTLPLGSHTKPVDPGQELSPQTLARAINDFLDALGLHDVTLVGNDSGGGICQFLVNIDDSRIGRLVLTNCDTFDKFPPFPFNIMFTAMRGDRTIKASIAATKPTAIRQSALGFGTLTTQASPELTRSWIEPALSDKRIRIDLARLLRNLDGAELDEMTHRMAAEFTKPLVLIWGQRDRAFKPEYARRLHAMMPASTLIEVPDASTFIPVDKPEAVADGIASLTVSAG